MQELVTTLDALLALERPDGGWTFVDHGRRRARPITLPLRLAEWLAGPLGLARWDLVVVRSPGTPAGGLALLAAYRLTGRAEYLAAARRAGDLLHGLQLQSGGWLSEMPAEGQRSPAWFRAVVRRCGIDDDVTPGAVRLLLALWEITGEQRYRDSAERGLTLLLRAQLPSGAWPLIWRPAWKRALWRTWEDLAALNDGATTGAIVTMLAGWQVLGRADLLAAARRGGDWLVAARHDAPQAGWAQQYDAQGRPASARRYEHAALASWESRYAIETLLALAGASGERRYCAPIPDAADWLVRSAIAPGCWARFYTLGANAPLYVDERGRAVGSPEEAHRPYDWQGEFGIPACLARLAASGVHVPGTLSAHALPRVAGDPGHCRSVDAAATRAPASNDPRLLIAHAARLIAVIEPPPPSPCGGTAEPRLGGRRKHPSSGPVYPNSPGR